MIVQNSTLDLRGVIIAYSTAVNAGLIKAENGEQYAFGSGNWDSAEEVPRSGLLVKFASSGQRALRVVISQKETISGRRSRRSAPRD